MHLESNIALIYNDGVAGQKSTKVKSTIVNVSRTGDCDQLGANFIYQDLDSTESPKAIIDQGGFTLDTAAEIQALFDLIKADLPDPNVDEPLYERTKYYMAFRLRMIETFLPLNPALVVADIDIVA